MLTSLSVITETGNSNYRTNNPRTFKNTNKNILVFITYISGIKGIFGEILLIYLMKELY